MNHLAHCFLSFDDEDVLLGNFIGDFVKGSDWQKYPREVQKGILLHRRIDSYTDNHHMTDQSVRRIRPFAGRYAPPFVDILYDHLLAIKWDAYSPLGFDQFAENTYQRLQNRVSEMPAPLNERLPLMLKGRFLHGYRQKEGLEWVLQRFSSRLPGQFDASALGAFFFDEIAHFSSDFDVFFPDLLNEVRTFQIPAP